MKKTLCAVVSFVLACGLVFGQAQNLSPQPDPPGRSLVLPIGTKLLKPGPSLFKFTLPDGQALQAMIVQKTSPGNYLLGESSVFDKAGKLLFKAKGGSLAGSIKPTEANKQADPKNYIKIDDDMTWLPVRANLTGIVNPDPPPRTVDMAPGTTAQKLSAGLFKFTLPDKQSLQAKILQKSGPGNYVLGESSFFDKSGKLLYRAKGGTLVGSQKPLEPDKQADPKNYIKIDDDISWLPVRATLTGVINPDPPDIP